jgi:hypothetical protein
MKGPTEKELRQILTQFPSFLTLHDTAGRVVWSSRIGYGLPRSIIGRPSIDRVVPEDRAIWQDACRRAIHQRETVPYGVRVAVPEPPGHVVIEGYLGPVVIRGRVRYVAAVARDAGLVHSGNPLLAFLLSARSKLIVGTLLDRGAMKSAALAKSLGVTTRGKVVASTLRFRLGTLCERGILVNTPAGYAVSEAFRPYARHAVNSPTTVGNDYSGPSQ